MLALPWTRPKPWLFAEHKKRIYRYFDGMILRRTDPLPLHQKLIDVGPELDIDLRLSASLHRDAPKGHVNVLKTIRRVFEINPYEEGGLTEAETTGLLNHFLGYVGQLKRRFVTDVEMCQGNLAFYASLVKRKPTYEEYCGFKLNHQFWIYQQAGPVFFGAMAALGGMDPGMTFWRAICGSEGQAMALKGQLDAVRRG